MRASGLPAQMRELLEEAPRRRKLEHILQLVHWRLIRGRTFSVDEIVASSRYKTSQSYVAGVVESLVERGLVVRRPAGDYGPAPQNQQGAVAMLRSFARTAGEFSRRQAWLGMPVAVPQSHVDRLLRELLAQGEIERIGHGRYRMRQKMPKAA